MSDTFELKTDEHGKLVLKRPGKDDVVDVRLRRSFPWSNPDGFISVRSSGGHEVMLIESTADLPEAARGIVERSLESSVFTPRITRVDDIDVRFGHQEWKVQTDRGPVEFRVQEREDIRFHPDGRYSLKDADGMIYELPRRDELDEHSRRKLEPLI
jgi:hypothetical protein